jgi:hypothetical protein
MLSLSCNFDFRQGKLKVTKAVRTRNSAATQLSSGEPVNQARLALATTFLKRSVKMLERVSSAASSETLKAALSSATDVGGVASLLSDLAPLGIDLSAVDPLVEAMSRGATVKRELLQSAGGGLTSSQVAAALGITRQAVDKRRSRRALLAVPNGSGEYLYPACQFIPDGIIPGFEGVLHAFAIRNPWTQLSVLLAPAAALAGMTILEALKSGRVENAIGVAASFGEQAA